jgi:anti-sigma regulatory factor (Ser/Thr protein kinase)
MLLPGETFSASYPAEAQSVPAARTALTEFAEEAGADDEQLEAIQLAASEAITNAVIHAYESPEQGEVQVNASYVEGELWLLVADTGHGLRPRRDSPGLGLGLVLVAQLADEFQILSRGSGGTELRMRFNLPTCEDPASESARQDPASESGRSMRERRQLIRR